MRKSFSIVYAFAFAALISSGSLFADTEPAALQGCLDFLGESAQKTAAAQIVDMEHANKISEELYAALVRNQKHVKPTWNKVTASINTRFIGREDISVSRLSLTSKKANRRGTVLQFRIETSRQVQINTFNRWINLDPVMEVQFAADSTVILAVNYFWSLNLNEAVVLFPAAELRDRSSNISVDFAKFDRAIAKILNAQ